MTEKNTTKVFYAFLDWSEGKSFNEILGCAKSQIENLTLIWDVDDYNFNEIACRVRYWDVLTDTSCRVEIKVFPNGQLNMVNLDEPTMDNNSRLHEKGCEELQNDICKLLNTTDEDKILQYWNECVDNNNSTELNKVYELDVFEMEQMLCCLSEEEKDKVLISLCKRTFDVKERYFYITEDCEINSCNSIWSVVELPLLYDYLTEYVRIERYGKTWNRSLYHMAEKDEWKVCEMDNGDEIWMDNVKGYMALYTKDRRIYLHLI